MDVSVSCASCANCANCAILDVIFMLAAWCVFMLAARVIFMLAAWCIYAMSDWPTARRTLHHTTSPTAENMPSTPLLHVNALSHVNDYTLPCQCALPSYGNACTLPCQCVKSLLFHCAICLLHCSVASDDPLSVFVSSCMLFLRTCHFSSPLLIT